MTWTGLNQRAFPRIEVKCDITISSDKAGETLKTHTQNLGLGGTCVILSRQLEKFSKVMVRLMLESSTIVECVGRVVWVIQSRELGSTKTSYDTGIEFVDLNSEDNQKIQSFLSKLHS